MKNKFYITTTLPYVNAEPHVGFAMELIQTDVIARYHKLLGEEVFFNTGTDEHGLKIYRAALESGFSPQEYVDQISDKFKKLKELLSIDYSYFIRTTDSKHIEATQEFWRRCNAAGDIYKKNYKIKYCVGCELEKTDSELENGHCLIHPNLEIEEIEEENYFFRFSKYQDALLKYYKDNPSFVLPSFRFNEIKKFVEGGLKDFSISRLKSKMPWGVLVPDDNEHSIFVWFDALVGYISALGWPHDIEKFNSFWPGTQTAGKDNLRQQSAIWQAMLMSAGLPNSKQILIHGFINIDGQKMSKSLGNVTDPFAMVDKYGSDVVRYFLMREIPSDEDGDFSEEKLVARYNGDLANGLGNLVARVATLIDNNFSDGLEYNKNLIDPATISAINKMQSSYGISIDDFKLHEALIAIWELVAYADKYVNDTKPWALVKENIEEFKSVMTNLVEMVHSIAKALASFMPETADKIFTIFDFKKEEAPLEAGRLKVQKGAVLFPRLEQ